MRQLLSVRTVADSNMEPIEVYQVSQTVRATSGHWLFVRMTQQKFFCRLNQISDPIMTRPNFRKTNDRERTAKIGTKPEIELKLREQKSVLL